MAYKTVTVAILDVSMSMGQPSIYLQGHPEYQFPIEGEPLARTRFEFARQLLRKFMLYQITKDRKQSHFAMYLCGTRETKHQLIEELPKDYHHIELIHPLERAHWGHIEALQAASGTTKYASDFLNAIIVALDLIQVFCGTSVYRKRILVLTDGGSSFQQLDGPAVLEMIAKVGVSVDVIGMDMKPSTVPIDVEYVSQIVQSNKPVPNEHFIRMFAHATNGVYGNCAEALTDTTRYTGQTTKPTTTFRGPLVFAKDRFNVDPKVDFTLPVHMYCCSTAVTPIKSHQVLESDPDVELASRLVPRELKIADTDSAGGQDNENELSRRPRVPPLRPLKNPVLASDQGTLPQDGDVRQFYQLGDIAVETSCLSRLVRSDSDHGNKDDSDMPGEGGRTYGPGIYVTGFVDRKEIKPEYICGHTYYVVSAMDTVDPAAQFASFVRALQVRSVAALVQYVRSVSVAAPTFGALFADPDGHLDRLYFAPLPFNTHFCRFVANRFDTKSKRHIIGDGDVEKSKCDDAQLDTLVAKFIKGNTMIGSTVSPSPSAAPALSDPRSNYFLQLVAHRASQVTPELGLPAPAPYLIRQFQPNRQASTDLVAAIRQELGTWVERQEPEREEVVTVKLE